MHPALKVPEILCLIFECDLEEIDLFDCSLVCRLWGIWAPDVLWRTCRVPLQGVLQSLAPITNTIYDKTHVPCVEIGNIEEEGWRRFLVLSNKIVELNIDCGIEIASLKRITLAKQSFNGEPFDQLQDIRTEFEYVLHETINFVTGASLERILVSCYFMEKDGVTWVANRLPVMAPKITFLGLSLGSDSVSIEISRYSALRRLMLCSYSIMPHLWENLASCRFLTKIALISCMQPREREEGLHSRGDFVYFPALRTLEVEDGHPGVTLGIILRSRMPMLECLWWDKFSRAADRCIDLMAAHLKLFSPRVDTDMLYHIHDTDGPKYFKLSDHWLTL